MFCCRLDFLSPALLFGTSGCKNWLFDLLWMCGCNSAARQCANARLVKSRAVGMGRGAMACEAPAGRAISVGFRRNCIQRLCLRSGGLLKPRPVHVHKTL